VSSRKKAAPKGAEGPVEDKAASGAWPVGRSELEIIAHAIHDARGVLGALEANVDWLRGALRDHPVAGTAAALDDLATCSRRLTGLLRESLYSARDQLVLKGSAETKASSLASRSAEGVKRHAAARHVTINIVGGEDALIVGDPGSLERVLRNLLDNALRFSRFGGRVTLSYGVEESSAVLTVADEGPGVPVELQEHIFEAFQTNKGGRGEHTGLGLAFCRKVARAHGGDVSVRNRAVAGALFSLTLPLAAR